MPLVKSEEKHLCSIIFLGHRELVRGKPDDPKINIRNIKKLSLEEFDKRIGQPPGIKDDGHGNWVGIELLTPEELKERRENGEIIRQVLCQVCG